jgi:5'-nucleotidase
MTVILITNDDGVYSAGLRASYESLKDLGEVYVVAPAVQRSGVGRSISIMEPIRISEISVNGMKVFAVDGTPTDAIVLGIHEIIGDIPDLTVCGINLGENLSSEAATTSGTVCAALEAATQGSKAFAISLEMPDINKFDLTAEFDFSYAQKILRLISRKILKVGLPEGVDLLNVNVPLKPNGGLRITKLARKMYSVRIERRVDPRGREYYWIYGDEIREAEEGTDLWALKRGYVSVTPMTLDLTANVDFEAIRRWLDVV